MKIFTTKAIREIDEATIKADNMSTLDLMERAAQEVSFEIMSRWRPVQRIVIFAGPGNNGGDALAVARLLYEQGYRPEVYLFNIKSSHLSPACATNRDRLVESCEGINFTEIVRDFIPPELGPTDVVIDGLFGSGLRTPLKGGYTALVQYINDSHSCVVSIDVPSGLFGEWNTGCDRRNIIRASLTLAFQFKRLSFFFKENAGYIGECKVLDLEMNADAIANTATDFYLIERQDVQSVLKPLNRFIHKYDNGTVLVVAGSYGMMGAAVLAARGAMRSGAGLVTVHAPRCGYVPLQTAAVEALFEADPSEFFTTQIELHHDFKVVALGPGMGTRTETVDALDSFLKSCRRPCILDADALRCIHFRPVLLRSIPKGSVLTPHATEFDALFGKHNSEEERLKKAIEVSKLHEVTIVLKGHYTMTVRPDGKVYVNSTGNPGMATAGSGDVLTGVIAGLMAQGYPTDCSVWMGVYVHGLAGDLAARVHGEHGLMAGDIADAVGPAIADILSDVARR